LVVSHSSVLGSYQAKLDHLAALGWEAHLAAPAWWPEAAPRRALERPFPRVKVHALRAVFHGAPDRFLYLGLGSLARRLRPDVVLAEEEFFVPACWQALRAARACGARFAFYTWENQLQRYHWPLESLAARVLARADLAVAGSAEGLGILQRRGWKGPCLVMPQYGVDPHRFRPATRRALRPFTVGYLGRLVPEKGIRDLLEAFARLRGARLRLAGSGPLAALAAGRPGVELTGALDHAAVPGFLQGLDALVLPSRSTPTWKEQFGRVLAEAMACGVPCLGSDSGAIPEVLGKAGLVAKEGDVDAWASALKRLASSAALRTQLSKAGRARSLKLFAQGPLAAALGSFLEGLIPSR
jgi:glycosyltransferase involved in cell wall biosynthesis